jgi:hypothetical protein
VEEKTEVLIHNPNDFTITFYKKAVRAPLEDADPIAPGAWKKVDLKPDHAIRVNCDDIATLLTGDPTATFIGTYGIGVKVEGFVVVGVGPNATGTSLRYSPLDVTAEYSRSSEVLKKDISYQPWWRWWWWPLPWRLAYPYQRIIALSPDGSVPDANIDCRANLYEALARDVEAQDIDPQLKTLTHQALDAGAELDPTSVMQHTGEASSPALVAMVGRCDKISHTPGVVHASVDYVLLSNKGPSDPDPSLPGPTQSSQVVYPWIPGRWYDLTVVMPQNVSKDLDDYMYQWHTQRWIAAGANSDIVSLPSGYMQYFFPYSCGWGYWWWWWHGGDCIDIGVGEGESIDVEQVTPVRVFMSQWPPIP